jgi:hypothetical protein
VVFEGRPEGLGNDAGNALPPDRRGRSHARRGVGQPVDQKETTVRSRFENGDGVACLAETKSQKDVLHGLPAKHLDRRFGMQTESLMVTFPDMSVAEGNRLAATLAEALRDVDPNVVVDRQRERPDAQDFGATLAIILGTAAATAVAKGIAAWLTRNSGAQIEIRRKGKVILRATHLDSKDVSRIAEALSSEG